MKLADHDYSILVIFIIKKGGKEFLDSLVPKLVPYDIKGNARRCLVCSRKLRSCNAICAITDSSGARKFYDNFDSWECCEQAIDWVRYIYDTFLRMFSMCKTHVLTIADLDDSCVRLKLKMLKNKHDVQVWTLAEFARETKLAKERANKKTFAIE